MKQIISALVILAHLGMPQVFAQRTIADANAQLRSTGPFNGIEVSSSFDVYISQSQQAAVAVSAGNAAWVDQITTEVRNGILYVGFNNKGGDWNNKNLKAYISVAALNKIRASGACDVYIEGELKAEDLELEISGSSDFRGKLRVNNLRLTASGSSDYYLDGVATNAKINVSGSSDVKAFELETDFCDVNASGASDVSITAQKELKVKASGSSDVNYKGNATIREISTNGSSDVKKRN